MTVFQKLPKKIRLCIWIVLMSALMSGISKAEEMQDGNFSGSWIANGTRQVLPFGDHRKFYIFNLSGHVNLGTPIGGKYDFWSEVIGFSDSQTGTIARCVWSDLDDRQQLFIELKTKRMSASDQVFGKIVGGTGRYAKATGTMNFTWRSVTFYKENGHPMVSGQTTDLEGDFHLPEF